MHKNNRIKQFFESKFGQGMPGWAYIVALILGLFVLGFLIWIAVKSGRTSVEQLGKLR